MDRRWAPDVPCRPRQAREGRLARHFPTLCHDTDTDTGGQPCPEVLPEAEQPHTEEEEVQPLWCGNWSEFSHQLAFSSLAVYQVILPVIYTLCRLKVPTRQQSAGHHQYPSCNSPACRRWPPTQGRRRELCCCLHAWTWWWAVHHNVLVVVVVMHHSHRTHLPFTWWQSLRRNSRCLIWSWRCRHPGYPNSLVPPGERLFSELSELPDLLLSLVLIKKRDGNQKLASRRIRQQKQQEAIL